MPGGILPYINIALDLFGAIIVLIIYSSCLSEQIRNKSGSKNFLILLTFTVVALIADVISWICEARPEYRQITLISNTVAAVSGYLAIICFMGYLKNNVGEKSRALDITVLSFKILACISVLFLIGNVFFEYAFTVDAAGHYVKAKDPAMAMLYLQFPILSFVAIILIALFAKRMPKGKRVAFIVYALFPIVGLVIDYAVHGFSLAYIGLVVSALLMYTNIYLQKQKLIDAQRNAIMLSQINPHFMYNTLSTIASMCVLSPKQAQRLTVDFSTYLRQNLSTLSCEELIPFEREIEHVECYLKIEKARFGERLDILWSIQNKDFDIPPLTVQPIVENAIRHGITKKAQGGTVKISTYATDKTIVIEIKDDGVGFDTEAGVSDGRDHIGISNVKSRIERKCKGSVTVKSTEGVGTRVTIEIPKKKIRKERV